MWIEKLLGHPKFIKCTLEYVKAVFRIADRSDCYNWSSASTTQALGLLRWSDHNDLPTDTLKIWKMAKSSQCTDFSDRFRTKIRNIAWRKRKDLSFKAKLAVHDSVENTSAGVLKEKACLPSLERFKEYYSS